VITLGAGIILTPTPFKLVVYNWIIESFNLNLGNTITLSEMGSSNTDYWLGFGLIISALLHNVFSKWILHQNDIQQRASVDTISTVDKSLFKEFLEVFPSGSRSSELLHTHDFEHSFSLKSLDEIDKFVNEWNCPEKSFIDPKLETIRKELWVKCNEFSRLIADKSSPTCGGLQSVVPDQHRNDWDRPKWINDDIKLVNNMASEVFTLHQTFIKSMREVLKC
jgi:hypothetical protein